MNRLSIVFLALLLLAAAPQHRTPVSQAKPSAAAIPVPVQTYNLNLTGPEIAYIAQALQTRPYADVAPLLNKMQQQVNAQAPALKGSTK